jgi:hypothetical protein
MRLLLTSIIVSLLSISCYSQFWITGVTSSPSNANDCDIINVIINGNLSSSNCSFVSSHSITGSVITIDVNVSCSGIGLPAITPYNETVILGTIPANNYTLIVNQNSFGGLQETNISLLSVGSCCNATSSITLANSGNCIGETTSFIDSGTVGSTLVWKDNGAIFNPSQSALGWSHIFLNPGFHNIVLTSIDSTGCSDSSSVAVNIYNLPVITLSSIPATCNSCSDGEALATVVSGPTPHNFLWDMGNTSNPLTGLSPGNYSVTLVDGNSCSTTESITVGNSVGIKREESFFKFDLYPNPSCGLININITQIEKKQTILQIINLTGELVMEINLGAQLIYTFSLDLELSRGIYLMKINNTTKKFSLK